MTGVEEAAPTVGKIRVKIICPLYTVVETEAVQVSIPTSDGERTIIPERAPLFIGIRSGRVIIYQGDGRTESYFVSRGLCEVRRNICVILAWGVSEKRVSIDEIHQHLAEAKASIPSAGSEVVRHNISERIQFFNMVLQQISQTEGDAENTAR